MGKVCTTPCRSQEGSSTLDQTPEHSKRGISINNIIFRQPTSVPITDSSKTGIGGYSLNSNTLWRYQFTIKEQRSFTLNTKEYIAAVVGTYFALKEDKCATPCILSLSNSSSTVSWLHKSNHDPTSSPIHNAVARWHAQNLMANNACDYSQHVAGLENIVANCLSRDFHLTDKKILALLHDLVPHLLPPNPQIISLPTHLSSWIATIA